MDRMDWIWVVHCMLSISQARLNRRLKDLNLEISHSFSTIDDDTLNGIVRSIKEEFPNSGYRIMVWGHLKRRGLHGYSAVPC